MTSYFISPTIIVDSSNVKNIMSVLTNNIYMYSNPHKNFVDEQTYIKVQNIVFEQIHTLLKKYIFYPTITNINVQIYNGNIQVLSYMNFFISDTNFKVIFSKWYDFYYIGNISSPIVYNNMDVVEQDNLTNSIVSGKFYMANNLEFELNLVEYFGIILTNNHTTNCKNICMCNNSYVYEPNIIVSVYWN